MKLCKYDSGQILTSHSEGSTSCEVFAAIAPRPSTSGKDWVVVWEENDLQSQHPEKSRLDGDGSEEGWQGWKRLWISTEMSSFKNSLGMCSRAQMFSRPGICYSGDTVTVVRETYIINNLLCL
jgi:hypothetical protein